MGEPQKKDEVEAAPSERQGAPTPDPERTVCFCHNVPCSRLVAEIRAGARTFEELQAKTRCSTGCGGCEFEVREILAQESDK
ncbi:MAG TPA: (2Fe-2S)-binding protein [Bdellovibrionota bacterium]|jgi:NAD(P)H-nitrite reductase large subunit|nr:(2Fe-2S)-binding protein [Bdellovibrionota bacterium]